MPGERVRVSNDQSVERRTNPIILREKRRSAREHCEPDDKAELRHNAPTAQACAGQCRSRNHVRYFVIFARCAGGACRLQVDASSLLSGAPQRSSTQSFGLYAISRATARSITSLSESVHASRRCAYRRTCAPQLRREHALQFGLHVRDALVLRHRVALGPPRHAIRIAAHHVDRDQQAKIARRRGEIFPRAAVSKIAGPSGMLASPCPLFWNLRPFSTAVTRVLTCSSSDVIASFIARIGSSGAGDITSSMRS